MYAKPEPAVNRLAGEAALQRGVAVIRTALGVAPGGGRGLNVPA